MIRSQSDRVKAIQALAERPHMMPMLPPTRAVRVDAAPRALTESGLERADGALLLLPRSTEAAQRVAGLPFGRLWRDLLERERRAGSEWPVLVTRLPNRRGTLAAVGFVRPDAAG